MGTALADIIVSADTERERDAKRKADKRAHSRDLSIPAPKDPNRRADLGLDDCAWLRWYLPDVFYHPFTSDQKSIITGIGEALRFGTSKCFAAPRRDGKTTITKYLALKYGLYRVVKFPLIISATGPKAEEALTSIKANLRMSSKRLLDDFPLECGLARYVAPAPARANNVTVSMAGEPPYQAVFMEWRSDRLILPKYQREIEEDGRIGTILMADSIFSDQIQGCNVYDIRPDFLMLDDLDSRDSLTVEDGKIAGKIEEIIDKNLAGLGGQGRNLGQVMLCTITSRRSVAYRYSDPKIKAVYSGVRIKRLRKPPENRELWDQYIELRQKGQNTLDEATRQPIDPTGREAHRFYLTHRAEMDAGAELSNPNDFNRNIAPDGSEMQASALQMCFDYIADKGEVSFQTEHQNDPPADDSTSRLVLTAYHIQHNCRSGLNQRVVPADTSVIVTGVDVKKLGLHFTDWAFNDSACGCCVNYGFYEINTEGKDWKAVEASILRGLHAWREERDSRPFVDEDGCERLADLTLIDRGWKHESWAGQPVDRFCGEMGFTRFLPSLGAPNYRTPKPNRNVVIGDNFHVSFDGGYPIVHMNSDHWKLKVHEGFLINKGEPGSLVLFDPPKGPEGRAPRQPHMSYAKHITSEVWERRTKPGFNAIREGWWYDGTQNHWFDATYSALVGMSIRQISTMPRPVQPHLPEAPAIQSASAPQLLGSESAGRNRW